MGPGWGESAADAAVTPDWCTYGFVLPAGREPDS